MTEMQKGTLMIFGLFFGGLLLVTAIYALIIFTCIKVGGYLWKKGREIWIAAGDE